MTGLTGEGIAEGEEEGWMKGFWIHSGFSFRARMCVGYVCSVVQSCLTLCDPLDVAFPAPLSTRLF